MDRYWGWVVVQDGALFGTGARALVIPTRGQRVIILQCNCRRSTGGASGSLGDATAEMMSRRNFFTFEADFPNESQWTENGSPLAPDGRSIADVMAQALNGAGLSVSDVAQHGFYGWAWEARRQKRVVWHLLQGGEPWLLIVEERRGLFARLFRSAQSAELEEVLGILDDALKRDARFSAVQRMTRKAYESRFGQDGERPV